MRDYMKALCYRFETTSRRAEYLDRKVEQTYRPVSYTHLDVYKRQAIRRLKSF